MVFEHRQLGHPWLFRVRVQVRQDSYKDVAIAESNSLYGAHKLRTRACWRSRTAASVIYTRYVRKRVGFPDLPSPPGSTTTDELQVFSGLGVRINGYIGREVHTSSVARSHVRNAVSCTTAGDQKYQIKPFHRIQHLRISWQSRSPPLHDGCTIHPLGRRAGWFAWAATRWCPR